MRRISSCLLVLLISLLFVSSVYAEVKFDYGASLRLRQEIWDDVIGLGTSKAVSARDRNFFRLRTSVWGKADITNDLGAYLRLTNEAKYYIGPFKPNAGRTDASVNNDRLDEDELIIDNLYLDAKNVFGLPVDVRIGRQDFLGPNSYGEGFLILDGTPGDGSRSFYFNAAKLTWRITPKNSIDFVYINNAATDTYLPSLHPAYTGSALYRDNKKLLNAGDEEGYVVYSRNKVGDNLTVEPYYIHKVEDSFRPGGPVPPTSSLHLNTIGARIVYAIPNSWKFGGEFAHQFGEYSNGTDRRGDGGYVFIGRAYPNVKWKPEFDLRFVYLSGDDPSTTKIEAWNPLFSRAPYWNELIIYTLLSETGSLGGPIPGYWTNFHIYKASTKLYFNEKTNLTLAYQYLRADEENAAKTALFNDDSKDRGHLPTALLYHKFSKKVDGFLQFEYFIPGQFYRSAADEAIFFRWQLQVSL
ncbi:MAG: alginate export family protein [Nitrospirota bacterium]